MSEEEEAGEEEEEEEEEEETADENNETVTQQPQPSSQTVVVKKSKQKLRTPFRPPAHLRDKPCQSLDGGKTWTPFPWNKRHALPGGDAWIQPIREFFPSTRELVALKVEDRSPAVRWKQDFEYCYGVHWPLRHLGVFMASEEVAASVSHPHTPKEGKQSFIVRPLWGLEET